MVYSWNGRFVFIAFSLPLLCLLFAATQAAADTFIDTNQYDISEYGPSPNSVFINSSTGYVFYLSGPYARGGNAVFRKTVDGGATWGNTNTLADYDQNHGAVAVWYDGWNAGDTGTFVHVAHVGYQMDDLMYYRLDIANDTVAPTQAIHLGSTYSQTSYAPPTIAKSSTGRLFAYCGMDGASIASWSDDGAVWNSITPSGALYQDWGQLLPLDNGDMLFFQQDASANMLRSCVWTNSDMAWGPWSNVATWVEYTSYDTWFGGTVYTNTGDIYLAGHTRPVYNNFDGDLMAYRFNASTRTWTTLGTVVDDKQGQVGGGPMMINQANGDLYAAYSRGHQNYFMNVFYKKSTDGGLTWSEQSDPLNSVMSDIQNVKGSFGGHGRLYATWHDRDTHRFSGASLEELDTGVPLSAPASVTNTAAYRIGATNAWVGGHVAGANPEAGIIICWDTVDYDDSFELWRNHIHLNDIIATSGNFSANMPGLTAGTDYYFRCFATNSLGGLFAEATESFTTIDYELTISDRIASVSEQYGPSPSVVFISDQVGYIFYIDYGNGVAYRKTSNGGTSWSDPVSMAHNQGSAIVSVWCESWTPGSVGSRIHLATAGQTDDDAYHCIFDPASDTFGSWNLVKSGTAFGATSYATPTVTTATDGRIFCYGGGAFPPLLAFCSYSDDDGVTWTSNDPPAPLARDDIGQLLPLSNGDVLLIQNDVSLNKVHSIVWSDAGSSWGPLDQIDTWNEGVNYDASWSASIKSDTGDIYLAGSTAPGIETYNGGGQIKCYKFTEATRTWTTQGVILDDPRGETAMTTLLLDNNTGDMYVLYGEGFCMNPNTASIALDIMVRKSIDQGVTWSDATRISSVCDDHRAIRGNLTSDERLYAIWMNSDLDDMYGATIADLVPPDGGSTPLIHNLDGASDISTNMATLNAFMVSTGALPTSVTIYYGKTDQGTASGSWEFTNVVSGTRSEGAITEIAWDLDNDTSYYYRYAASNAAGTAWAATSEKFVTMFDPADYANRMRIIFGLYDGDETLTDFPAAVELVDGVGGFYYSNVLDNATDLRFTTSDTNMNLTYEIEEWNTNGTSVLWIKVPELEHDTGIWAFWNNPASVASPDWTTEKQTWSKDYKAVWHLNETVTDGASGGVHHFDATENAHDGIQYGNDDTNGLLAGGQQFSLGDRIAMPSVNWAPAEFTVSFWLKPQTLEDEGQLLGAGKGHQAYLFDVFTNGTFRSGVHTSRMLTTTTNDTPLVTNRWQQIAMTYKDKYAVLYQDGRPVASRTGMDYPWNWQGFSLSNTLDGVVDEVRLSTEARSTNWVWAEYISQALPSTFSLVGKGWPAPYVSNNNGATGVTDSVAWLTGYLEKGNQPTDVWVYWGTNDAVSTKGDWTRNFHLGTNTSRKLAFLATGMTNATFHYYRYYASNSWGDCWAPTAGVFRTRLSLEVVAGTNYVGSNMSFEVTSDDQKLAPAWTGDPASYDQLGTDGIITPFHGTNMLRALGTGGGSNWDKYQTFDILYYSDLFSITNVPFIFSARYNRTAASLDNAFWPKLTFYADLNLTTAIQSFGWDAPGYGIGPLYCDNDPSTWEIALISNTVPANAVAAQLRMAWSENVSDDGSNEFLGQYCDDLQFKLIFPTPPGTPKGTIILICGRLD